MKKNIINNELFISRIPKLINKFTLSKFNFDHIDLYNNKPCIYISPRTSMIDYNLISKCITGKFVFLKSNIVNKINLGLLTEQQINDLLEEIKKITELGFSIALIWNNSPSVFGENIPLSENMISILKKTNLDIKFLTFPGLYFCYPFWAKKPRPNKIFASQKVTINSYMLKGLSQKETIKTFNNSIPSSASVYSKKYEVHIKSNTRASGLESLIYACPNCKSLLSLYSEFSCLKCKECNSAFENGEDGKILFAKHISSFDDINDFQFKILSQKDLSVNELISYDKITQISSEKCKKPLKNDVILQIYPEKLIITNKKNGQKNELYYEDMDYVNLSFNNILHIKPKNANLLHFFGKSNENLLIIKDLVKLNKN